MISAERLREVLHYDPDAGRFIWKERLAPCCTLGGLAGSLDERGYRFIAIDRNSYRAHRLAYLYQLGQWPSGVIDHINGIKSDNRWINLRDVSHIENMRNRKINADNSTGYKGIAPTKNGKFRAFIGVSGKTISLGTFDTAEEAHVAYCTKAVETFGDFANFG